MIQKNDYFGISLCGLTIITSFNKYNSDIPNIINSLKYAFIANIVYDIIWLLIHADDYLSTIDYDFMFSVLQILCYIITLINLVLKCYLTLMLRNYKHK